MSALTDRIAKVLRDEANEVVFGESNEEAWRRLAERVVAELQLTEETDNRLMLTYDDPPAPKELDRIDVPGPVWATHYELVPSSRYISQWEPSIEHADPLRPWSEVQP